MPKVTQRITPFLWFDTQAEEAANFYMSIFKNSRIKGVARYDGEAAQAAGRPKGSVMTVRFELDGQEFIALNGGPVFKFTEAISFVGELRDAGGGGPLLGRALRGGPEVQCGWLKDRFGSRGRSCRPRWARCSGTGIRRSRSGSWPPS